MIVDLLDRVAALEADRRDTIPAPCGDSHSWAIVVPRGSGKPPVAICNRCGMFACVCYADLPYRVTVDGGDGEGGP